MNSTRVLLLTLLTVALLLGFSSFAAAGQDVMFYVSPKGSDSNPGTQAKPFQTIERVQQAVRAIKWRQRTGEVKNIVVMLRGGRYHLAQTMRFDENDSSNYGNTITYRNYPGEQPVLVAGLRVTGWKPYKAGIYKAIVPGMKEGIVRVSQLLEDGVPGAVARTPNEGWFRFDGGHNDNLQYKAADFNPAGWNISQLQVRLIETGTYFSNDIPVDSINTATRNIHLRDTPFYDKPMAGKTYIIQNALELLDTPGEFFADKKAGCLYYKPRTKDINHVLVEAIILEKTVDFNAYSSRNPVHDVVIEGLCCQGGAFPEYTRGAWCTSGDNGHTNDETDRSTAPSSLFWSQICFKNANRIAIRDCRLLNAGVSGIAITGASTNITVTGCEITGCGINGVLIKGDVSVCHKEDATGILDVNHGHTIHNNYIHHVGRLHIEGSGVSIVNSSDNTISNNLITDTPRMGVCMFSQWDVPREFCTMKGNIIRKNELARCDSGSWDGGAFYIGATSEDTTFENNRITDVWSWFVKTWRQPEDRPDDDASIDFDPGMTFSTYIRNNLCYGENAATLELGRLTDESILSNNFFESPQHPGKVSYDGKWVDATQVDADHRPFDASKVSMDIGLTSEFKYPYPKETIKPVRLPMQCGFEGTLSPLFLYEYGDGPLQQFLSRSRVHDGKMALIIDKDVLVARYRHPSPVSGSVTVYMYDDPAKKKAFCTAIVRELDAPNAPIAGIGVDCSVSPDKYVIQVGSRALATKINRKSGWHKLEFRLDPQSGCALSLDGSAVGNIPGVKSFTILDLGDPAFGSDSKGMGFDSLSIE